MTKAFFPLPFPTPPLYNPNFSLLLDISLLRIYTEKQEQDNCTALEAGRLQLDQRQR